MSDLTKLITSFGEEVSKLSKSSSYTDAKARADAAGDIMSRLLNNEFKGLNLTQDDINLVIKPFIQNGYSYAASNAVSVQKQMNAAAKIGMNPVRPSSRNVYRIDNLAERLLEDPADAEWLLGNDSLRNVCEDAVNSTIRLNAEKQERAGLSVRMTRKSNGKCCDWCESICGTFYSFKDLPDDFWAMHKDCSCTIEYHAAKVHTRISNYRDADGNIRKRTQNL